MSIQYFTSDFRCLQEFFIIFSNFLGKHKICQILQFLRPITLLSSVKYLRGGAKWRKFSIKTQEDMPRSRDPLGLFHCVPSASLPLRKSASSAPARTALANLRVGLNVPGAYPPAFSANRHSDLLRKQLESCELGQCPASVEEKTHRSRRNAMHMGTSPE